jgi:hypothetical protein
VDANFVSLFFVIELKYCGLEREPNLLKSKLNVVSDHINFLHVYNGSTIVKYLASPSHGGQNAFAIRISLISKSTIKLSDLFHNL